MSVADELQTIVADLSVAIAERKSFGRVELDRLRSRLGQAATEVRRGEAGGVVLRVVTDDVLAAIDAGIVNLAGVAKHARAQIGAE